MKRSTDVLIVGGGVIGCSIAYFLRKHGIDVIVLEKEEFGAQASSAAAGLLAPIRPFSQMADAFKTLQLVGIQRLATLVPELEEASGVQVEYEQCGTLRILPQEKIGSVQRWADTWRQAGYHIEILSHDEVLRREPNLYTEVPGAVSIAEEAQVTPTRLVKAYAQAAVHLGALLYSHTEVIQVQQAEADLHVTGVLTNQGAFSCNHLVIAAGAWSAVCGTWLHVPLPVRPVRGELIALEQPILPIGSIIFDEGVYDEDIYIAPKPNGTVVIGATKAEVGFDTSVTAGGVLHLLDIATRLVPSLKQSAVHRIWAGLRPKTTNGRPLLGPLPSWNNVIVASGHGGFGVTLSAITGETISDLIATGQIPQIIESFQPKSVE